jgi:hypothetical protein
MTCLEGLDLSKNIILHVGIHKTGTTALQEHIRRYSEEFSSKGLHYAPLHKLVSGGSKAHHHFAHFLAHDEIADTDLKSLKTGLYAIQNNIQVGQSTFISSEAFYRHTIKEKNNYLHGRQLYLQRVADVLSDFDVSVVVVLRRPEDYIRSLYQEAILQAHKPKEQISSFSNFRRRELGRSLRYGTNLNMLSQIFPKVKVLLYEDLLVGGNICSSFFGALGFRSESPLAAQTARISLTPLQSKIKLFINSFGYSGHLKFKYLEWIRSNAVSQLIADFYGTEEFDFWENKGALESFRSSIAPELARIKSDYFPNRDILFHGSQKDILKPVPELSDRFKAALLQLALQSSKD